MTEREQMEFCGVLCMAARRLRIFGRFERDYFVWFDPAVGSIWKSQPATHKKNILFNACKSLQDYLLCK